MMRVDYHVHVVAHGEYDYSLEWLSKYVNRAKEMHLDEIGFSEHDEFISKIDDKLINDLKQAHPDIAIKLGLELDYIPNRGEDITALSGLKNFDYLIGSVHFINGWGFDHPDYKHKFADYDIDIIYQQYFDLVDKAVKSNLFDVVGHLDLIKIWGHRPRKKGIIDYIKPVLSSIKDADLVVELNSAGLRKEVGEIYPQYEIISLMKEMGINITLGSDAHHPNQVGLDIDKLVFWAKKAGYNKIVSFDKREKTLLPL